MEAKNQFKLKCIKKALIRDNRIPVGQSAPLHVNCDCSSAVDIQTSLNVCKTCGTIYNGTGWIIDNDGGAQ